MCRGLIKLVGDEIVNNNRERVYVNEDEEGEVMAVSTDAETALCEIVLIAEGMSHRKARITNNAESDDQKDEDEQEEVDVAKEKIRTLNTIRVQYIKFLNTIWKASKLFNEKQPTTNQHLMQERLEAVCKFIYSFLCGSSAYFHDSTPISKSTGLVIREEHFYTKVADDQKKEPRVTLRSGPGYNFLLYTLRAQLFHAS